MWSLGQTKTETDRVLSLFFPKLNLIPSGILYCLSQKKQKLDNGYIRTVTLEQALNAAEH